MSKYIMVLYKPSGTRYSCGCLMENYDSCFDIRLCSDEEELLRNLKQCFIDNSKLTLSGPPFQVNVIMKNEVVAEFECDLDKDGYVRGLYDDENYNEETNAALSKNLLSIYEKAKEQARVFIKEKEESKNRKAIKDNRKALEDKFNKLKAEVDYLAIQLEQQNKSS